ncbi:hypothetical protein KI387_001218, partial [Taxus chinensis]
MEKEDEEGVECAECESERAQVVCCSESLAYCNPCSHKIHSKKARSHHTVLPIPPCSHCLIRSATLQCFQCSQNSKPCVLCIQCSKLIHSAPTAAKVHPITILSILSSIVKTENQFSAPVKQEKTESESGYSANKGRKRKRRGNSHSETVNKCPSTKRPKINVNKRMGNSHSEPVSKCPSGKRPKINVNKRMGNCDFESGSKYLPGKKPKINVKQEPQTSSLPRRNTPRAATRRVFGPIEIHDSSSESEADEDSNSCFSDFEEETGVRRIQRGSVSVEAFVVNAEDNSEEGGVGGGTNAGGIGKEESAVVGIKERIRKMLELGLHPDTPDIEAQQALKNAQRLLTKHNLQQAKVMKGALKDSEALAGGMRVVELRSKVKMERIGRIDPWVIDLAHVIADNFDTQYFTRKYTRKDRPLQ